MIAHVNGKLIAKDLDRVEVLTPGGVGYDLQIPLSVYESLPKIGDDVTLHTHLVVREDEWLLFGFANLFERRVFQKLLTANGVGPALALAMLSNLTAERLVRAIREKDVATLRGVPRVGQKKAERLVLDLADKLDEVAAGAVSGGGGPRPEGVGAEDAVRALLSLGYTNADAERAVRAALDEGKRGMSAPELIRVALSKVRG
jgi:holliday junction DNA helicase RuvA